jgi:hypothetical protein
MKVNADPEISATFPSQAMEEDLLWSYSNTL